MGCATAAITNNSILTLIYITGLNGKKSLKYDQLKIKNLCS